MFVLLCIIFIIVIAIYLLKQIKKPPNFPPGPVWLPFVGSGPELKKLARALGGQYLGLTKLAENYKTTVLGLKLGTKNIIAVFKYDTVKEILTNEIYDGRPKDFFIRLRCMGKRRGIVGTDGKMWHAQRHFVVRHLRNLGFGKIPMEDMIQNEITEMLDILETNKCDINISKFLAPAVLNILWTLTTGARITRESTLLNELLDLLSLRSKAFNISGGTLAEFPWLRHIAPKWSGYALIQTVNSKLKELIMGTISTHHETWEEDCNTDLVYRYISKMKMKSNGETLYTDDQLVMVCLDLFIAGALTTSETLDFAFLMMILHPDIQEKVHAEIDRNLKKDKVLKFSDRYKLPYVEAVLFETLRHYTVTPTSGPRRVLEDTELEGYSIPKNTTVLISLYSVHHDESYWKNPQKFMPERFLDENGQLLPHERLIPFGLGRRRCLGETLAKSCIFLFFVEILRKYTVDIVPGSRIPSEKPVDGISLSPEKYRAQFTER